MNSDLMGSMQAGSTTHGGSNRALRLPGLPDGVRCVDGLSSITLEITRWRELGAPAYLSRQQTKELAADNMLRASSTPVTVENGQARFTMESPGVALLEIDLPASAR